MTSRWLVLLNCCIALSLCDADICKNLTYAVKVENQPKYCLECRICSDDKVQFHSEACKKKIPEEIPGQGFAWCTHVDLPRPKCSSWKVLNGHINCSSNFDIMSSCYVICNRGYTIVKAQSVVCTQSLQWNVSEDSRPQCNRTDPPGKPTISSSILHPNVKAGTRLTLTCKNTTELMGTPHFIWMFNNNDLYNTRTQSAYLLVSVRKSDEGSYRCMIKDDIGESLPSEYQLDVENETIHPDEENKKLLSALLIVLLACTMITALFVIIRCRNKLKEKIISFVKCRSAQKWDSETASSTDTFDGLKIPLENESMIVNSHYTSVPVGDSKVYSTNPRLSEVKTLAKNCVQDPQQHSSDSSDSPLLKKNNLTETANSKQRALKELINNPELMKVIKKCLDQIPDPKSDKPTYRDLAKFLAMKEDDICHFEFICKQDEQSPTERLLLEMRANGEEIDTFISFLQMFNICQDLVQNIYRSFPESMLLKLSYI